MTDANLHASTNTYLNQIRIKATAPQITSYLITSQFVSVAQLTAPTVLFEVTWSLW